MEVLDGQPRRIAVSCGHKPHSSSCIVSRTDVTNRGLRPSETLADIAAQGAEGLLRNRLPSSCMRSRPTDA